MINLEDYRSLIDEIRKMDDEEVRSEVKASEEPIPSSEVTEDSEYLEWYENWKKENFNNEKE